MAARRIAQSSINWSALAERVPANQKTSFGAFKTKSDIYVRAVMANPESPPKIDWAYYKAMVPVAGLVDSFQKQYDALSVPYPKDTVSPQVDAEIKESQSEIASYKKVSEQRIQNYQKEIAHLKSLLPYDQMTMEDYRDAFPDSALDPLNKPTFWPHTPEEQVGYKSKEQIEAEKQGHH
ncbi:ATP synthase subunit d, mitochondrial [Drosophila guanche]|uniref:ATP synthase subunit d, mitochondrial n=3 Tax=obscura subgroup TaxID=32357 RepID=A0A3B0KM59_DROGU|nr:ATP synthase subunit d, mitochondrial [Drosophila guanche]XP_034138157.1 ATP synthase subunit d, mitochondrial [Drosophila guanche]SPP87659.1 blast:ATP synthase subunit d%2C mitochondrial [Drosophila guanche]